MIERIFQPRMAPRNASDTMLSIVIGIFQTCTMFVLPALVSYLMFPSWAFAGGVGIALYVVFSCFCVSNLVISSAGIGFTRTLGGPKFIPWSDISAIREVSRIEVIWRGWLWPLFPAREMTPTFTSLGHFRIQFGSKSVYFPPADPDGFMAEIQTHLNVRA